jgi:hypothetical protein
VKFRRKSAPASAEPEAPAVTTADELKGGPHDSADVHLEEGSYADLGSLWILPPEGREVQLRVDENTGAVESIMVIGPDGALELRAFAAPRSGDLWDDVRPEIVADIESRGGESAEQEGPHGTELNVRLQVQLPDGRVGEQRSRMLGINGPRWFLRASFLGAPAMDETAAQDWLAVLDNVIVHRGKEAMPVGEALPVVLPDSARPTS